MTIAITGGYGFLGWHIACRLRALAGQKVLRVGRDDFTDPERLAKRLEGVNSVINVAGVNRAGSEDAVEQGNLYIGSTLAEALRRNGLPVRMVNANSVQKNRLDSAYGRGKAAAADLIRDAVSDLDGIFIDVVLPNLFGEHGRPLYNSFVATFCYEIANGGCPTITDNREISLLHAQSAAQVIMDGLAMDANGILEPAGCPRMISEVLTLLNDFHSLYSKHGEFPDLSTSFATDLFNTYRSYTFPQQFPIYPKANIDSRGELYETGRMHGGVGQSYISITGPEKTRGEHYHLRKVERFFVLKGTAELKLRRLFDDRIFSFTLTKDRPGLVDMPTMWVHNITNIGNDDLITAFWSSQLLNAQDVDQFTETVEVSG